MISIYPLFGYINRLLRIHTKMEYIMIYEIKWSIRWLLLFIMKLFDLFLFIQVPLLLFEHLLPSPSFFPSLIKDKLTLIYIMKFLTRKWLPLDLFYYVKRHNHVFFLHSFIFILNGRNNSRAYQRYMSFFLEISIII